jgi:hypothetical protein
LLFLPGRPCSCGDLVLPPGATLFSGATLFFLAMPPQQGKEGSRQSVPCRNGGSQAGKQQPLNSQLPQQQAHNNVGSVLLTDSVYLSSNEFHQGTAEKDWRVIAGDEDDIVNSLELMVVKAMKNVSTGMCASPRLHDLDQTQHPRKFRRCPR